MDWGSRIKQWGPVVVWAGLIFWLSGRSLLPPKGSFFWDVVAPYLVHLGEYGFLFTLLWRARKSFWFCFWLALVYGVSDEWHQSFVPSRTCSLVDVLVDGLGIVFAWVGIWKLSPILPPRLKSWVENWLDA